MIATLWLKTKIPKLKVNVELHFWVMIMFNLNNRVSLITGAGSKDGIGFATARIFLEAGSKVVITSTSERIFDRVQELRDQFDANLIEGYVADLTVKNEVDGLILEITKKFGNIDILVNNAGMTQIGVDQPSRKFQELTADDWDYGIDINLKSTFLVTKGVLPLMKKIKFGRIINIASVTGPIVGINGSTVYSAAKAAMLGLTRSLAIEEGKNGITVNCIGPGWIKTASSSEEEITAGKHTPVGRPGTPKEIGYTVLFLASDESSYLTGQLIVVDGGNTIQEYKVELNS